jgi:hypothetical protein
MIPTAALLRLLRHTLGGYGEAEFAHGMRDGFFYAGPSADFDIQDIATLARIASGEAWEGTP